MEREKETGRRIYKLKEGDNKSRIERYESESNYHFACSSRIIPPVGQNLKN